eukprot:CAMPEP_0185857776 /NCGR_PEP_ID=MMETSP1354-20130828/29674_1 /TAXON_ID=708628 /ORGANISM="Erythrolobus madagascarensis, Strain CCMP3276" /LENGTH=462 /DNA_ID=CAMNT_0028560047 /DNA_START=26 /DNA_END=1414 /DNA_ORIENTATION=+
MRWRPFLGTAIAAQNLDVGGEASNKTTGGVRPRGSYSLPSRRILVVLLMCAVAAPSFLAGTLYAPTVRSKTQACNCADNNAPPAAAAPAVHAAAPARELARTESEKTVGTDTAPAVEPQIIPPPQQQHDKVDEEERYPPVEPGHNIQQEKWRVAFFKPLILNSKPLEIFVHDPQACTFISRFLLRAGEWHGPLALAVVEVMKELVEKQKRNEIFVDIGANIGSISLPVAYAGYNVISFEPLLYNTELFAAAIARNGLDKHVTLYKYAVSDTDSRGDMCTIPNGADDDPEGKKNSANGMLVDADRCREDLRNMRRGGHEIVQVRKIDTILKKETRCVGALKVDVEGFELFAFKGGRNVLFKERCKPCVVFFEHQAPLVRKLGRRPEELDELFTELGYKCFRGDGDTPMGAYGWNNHFVEVECVNALDQDRCSSFQRKPLPVHDDVGTATATTDEKQNMASNEK